MEYPSVGTKINKLTILEYLLIVKAGKKRRYILCKCECGKEKQVRLDSVLSNKITSCGCVLAKSTRERFSTHRMSYSDEYTSWQSMIARCTNERHKHYHNYGKIGITICDRWLHSFANFFVDMGFKPSKKHTLERNNNGLGYYKENCSWATQAVQHRNKRNNRWLEYNGLRMVLMDWSKYLNTRPATLGGYLKRHSIEEAVIHYKNTQI